ncbi:helix-turn-helix transcriptional regulator [Chitinophagaceae bacterium LB-8]|uniref:Helix-turn-helix transcriptional regulator n=1 Tax=Paraflavisolibacter caeni TaxID=2982496 RepID=A0A9X3B8K5_9BACT|nr:helix-turn-helix transcriptional regulator [Paraflavisolibacter caeni]MCU7549906.1 helix-turn-helix transcriptional regulator [Paraflavisolibacter caeni]
MRISNIFPMGLEEMGVILKERRQFLKLRQEDVAEISGVTIRSLHSIEQGTGNPSFETLAKIASVLGMELKIEVKQLDHG